MPKVDAMILKMGTSSKYEQFSVPFQLSRTYRLLCDIGLISWGEPAHPVAGAKQLEHGLMSSTCKLVSQKDLKLLFYLLTRPFVSVQARRVVLSSQEDLTSEMQTK